MTEQKINRKLAVAIGWKPKQIKTFGIAVLLHYNDYYWSRFDFVDWRVIGPIAQRYDCFPKGKDQYGQWFAGKYPYGIADTPQKAIALAVIAAHEAGC